MYNNRIFWTHCVTQHSVVFITIMSVTASVVLSLGKVFQSDPEIQQTTLYSDKGFGFVFFAFFIITSTVLSQHKITIKILFHMKLLVLLLGKGKAFHQRHDNDYDVSSAGYELMCQLCGCRIMVTHFWVLVQSGWCFVKCMHWSAHTQHKHVHHTQIHPTLHGNGLFESDTCMDVHSHTHTSEHTHIHISPWTSRSMTTYVCVCLYVGYVSIHNLHTHWHMLTGVDAHTHTHTHTHTLYAHSQLAILLDTLAPAGMLHKYFMTKFTLILNSSNCDS